MKKRITEWSVRGKDNDPVSTINNILHILEKAGIETEYKELDQTVDTCFASRVTLKGPIGNLIGANGKGLSKDLCKASAYGELMERLQNEIFTSSPLPFDPSIDELNSAGHLGYYSVRGEYQPECIQRLKDIILETVPKELPLFAAKDLVDSMLEEFSPGGKGLFYMKEFYSLKDKTTIALPIALIERFTLSNGMAAGNTLEEALVQGCSEIMERYSELAFLKGNLTPPDIPVEILEKYPSVSHIIKRIESEADGRYRVIVKDCSMGMELPVVCGIICDTRKQTFGVKFGAYPDMCIALERVFSESLQGNSLESFSSGGWPLFNDVSSRINSWNLIKTGYGAFPSRLLMASADYAFTPWPDVTSLSNRELAHLMFSNLQKLTPDIYICDVSFLGFPSVMIYAAGISESIPVDLFTLKEQKLLNKVQKYFHQNESLDEDRLKDLLMLIRLKRTAVLENNYPSLTGVMFISDPPGAPFTCELLFAITLYSLGETDKALEIMNALEKGDSSFTKEEATHIRTMKLYMSAAASDKAPKDWMEVLKKMCPADVLDRVVTELSDRKNAVWNTFPHCPVFDCANCSQKACVYPAIFEFYKKLKDLEMSNPVDSSRLKEIFSNDAV